MKVIKIFEYKNKFAKPIDCIYICNQSVANIYEGRAINLDNLHKQLDKKFTAKYSSQ